ncbi:MAG TPA: DUF4400 domain-containing protein [Lacipirellula sp.]
MGLLFAPLKWFLGMSLLLLALILAAWIIDWFFVFTIWPEGVAQLQGILDEDLERIARSGYPYRDLPGLAAGTANVLYALLFESTGIHGMGTSFAQASPLSIPDTMVRNAYVANFEAIRVAMVSTQLFGVRLGNLATALPLFALTYCAASVDGLTERAVRRARGGRESASLYHRAKYLRVIVLVTTAAVSLLVPVSIDPRYIWVPAALCVAFLARLQWAYYKKHL